MKKVLVVVCLIVMAVTAKAYAASPLDSYIQAITNLPDSESVIPKPPKGYGAVRDERTGNFLILVPKDYCRSDSLNGIIPLGSTSYGSRIKGFCTEF